jgi:hypothetical protein
MLRTTHEIVTGLIITLGALHVLVTFVDYDEFSLRALWFAGTGVAIILAGFLNIALSRVAGKDRVVWLLCLCANLIFTVMFVFALYLMQQPQVFIGVALFLVASITSYLLKSK